LTNGGSRPERCPGGLGQVQRSAMGGGRERGFGGGNPLITKEGGCLPAPGGEQEGGMEITRGESAR